MNKARRSHEDDAARAVHRTLLCSAASSFLTVYGDADAVTVVYAMDDVDDERAHAERIGEFLGVYEHVLEHEPQAPDLLRGVVPLQDEPDADAETLAWVMRRAWVDECRAGDATPDDVLERVAATLPESV